MKSVANKRDNKSIKSAEEEKTLYSMTTDKLCETCKETTCEARNDNNRRSKASVESHKDNKEKTCPAIKQININKFMY